MPSYLTEPANHNYDFGQAFNYAVWTEGTVVTLTNVPWNNDYRDICQFPSASGQTLDQYIDSSASTNDTINNISYIKFNIPIRINVPFNKAFMFNYLRVQNPLQPIPGTDKLKSYYYFILDVKYLAPNATELTIQLDIFQSFRNDFTFGNSYIERGHIGIANTKSFDNYGRDYLTIPEGIDYGSEYRIVEKKSMAVMRSAYNVTSNTLGEIYGILVVSTVDLTSDPGTVAAPKLVTAFGSGFEGLASGATLYYWDSQSAFSTYMQTISNTPWVSQGIISITVIPRLSRYDSNFVSPTGTAPTLASYRPGAKISPMYPNWRSSASLLNTIPTRYQHLKKLFTSPYMVIEMTTWTGKPVILKPESWNDPNGTIVETPTLTPPNQRIVFRPRRYNAVDQTNVIENQGSLSNPLGNSSIGAFEGGDDLGDYLDITTMIDNFPTMALVNNGALGYLASNFAGIPYQKQSAGWTQSRALRGNEVSYDQTNKGVQASKNINALSNAGTQAQAANANLLNANNQAVTGIGGVISATASAALGMNNGTIGLGGISSAVANQVMGAAVSGNQQAATTAGANISTNVSRATNIGQTNQTSYVNDTNKSLADWSARGDYENSIAGINAQVSDASMIQPTTSGQSGGDTYNLVTGNMELSIRWKLIDKSALRVVGEYWLRYGYAVRQFAVIPPSFMVMSKFTYWKLLETYIVSSSMPEGFKQIIRGIFEKGVTVWSDPSYIGQTDLADNTPLGGITL